MSERPTQTPASSASEPQASCAPKPQASSATTQDGLRRGDAPPRHATRSNPSPAAGDSLAARAERFRNGAPFLVERATLYDPDPLDLPVAPADRRPRAARTLLPAALTLLVVVVVVGLAAGILFVRNADGPRTDEAKRPGTGRLGQFSERVVPRPGPKTQSPAAPAHRDQVTYDLTRRSNDTIVGAWRSPKDVIPRPAEEARSAAPEATPEAAPEVVATPNEPPPRGLRRLMPRRLSGWLAKRRGEQIAEPALPPRAPLDDPYVPNASAEDEPAAPPRAPLDEPHVQKATAEAKPVAPAPAARDTVSAPSRPSESDPRRSARGAAERPGANVVARVGRVTNPKERNKASDDTAPPIEPLDADEPKTARERYAARRDRRAELRRLREARRQAIDLDRFLIRDKGEVPRGFVFSGPQAQRP